MERSRLVLAGLLQLLAVLYAVWFYGDRQYTLALLVFALFWFSHAVMVAWADPVKAPFAWAGIVLSVGIVLATSWPAFAKRFDSRE